jgi:exosortase A-associated hydrolase 2
MQPFYLPSGDGQRFCIYHCANQHEVRGAVLYVPPFAEEMNKSRRMAAKQARQLAKSGYAVLQMDLLGCGDSSGDFGDASWSAWKEDVLLGYRWLRHKTAAPLTLWGLRAGCLLAAEAAVDLPERPNFIFWQPVLSGKQHWQQFMRLKMAGELASGQAKGVSEQLKKDFAIGQAVEIAGYKISPELARGLEAAESFPLEANGARISMWGELQGTQNSVEPNLAWFELSTRENATLAPVSQKQIDHWKSAGYRVDALVVNGPAFWQTTEIEDAEDLIAATQLALELFR